MAVFAKFQDIDGESRDANHDKWIDVLSVEWGSSIPSGGTTGQSRRRGGSGVVHGVNRIGSAGDGQPDLKGAYGKVSRTFARPFGLTRGPGR